MGAIFLDDQNYSAPSVAVDTELSDTSENPIANKTVKARLDEKVSKEDGKGLSTNDYDDNAKSIVDGITDTLQNKVDKEDGKGLSTNDFTNEEKNKLDNINIEDSVSDKIDEIKGQANGLASLDASGKVPSDQLPSYVDDVIEGYYNSETDKFYEDPEGTKEITAETGKIYLDVGTDKTYRWSGTTFIQVGGSDIDESAFLHKDGSVPADYLTIGIRKGDTAGSRSLTQGNGNTASGTNSHAEGGNTTASGTNSHAEGSYTKATEITTHAEGSYTTASGPNSHAEGSDTTASGPNSHAEGANTIAGYAYQHVSGLYNDNKSDTLFEVGNGTVNGRSNAFEVYKDGHINVNGDVYQNGEKIDIGGSSLPDGGSKNQALVKNSAGDGDAKWGDVLLKDGSIAADKLRVDGQTVIDNDLEVYGNVANGNDVSAIGLYSHAEGDETTARGAYSHSEGLYTVANYEGQHVTGKFNDNKSATLFEVGNGDSISSRSNAFEVYKDGHINVNGDIYQKGSKLEIPEKMTVDSTPTEKSTNPVSSGGVYDALKNAGGGIPTGGSANQALVKNSAGDGDVKWEDVLLKDGSVAADYLTVGTRKSDSTVGSKSLAAGSNVTASGSYSVAEGIKTSATFIGCHAEGDTTTASGMNAHAEGCASTASGDYSHAEGFGNTAGRNFQHVSGKYNDNKTDTLLEIGNGTKSLRSNAFEVTSDGFIRTHNNAKGIAFGQNSDGKWGYIVEGTNTVIPFNT